MMDLETARRERLKLLHWLEQLSAALFAGEKEAEQTARIVLARIAVKGSVEILAQVFRGIVLSRDEEQKGWDRLLE